MSTYFERYQNGEHEQVWSELRVQGNRIRSDALFPDALAVARETMRRARHNVQVILHRLTAMGYVFVYPQRAFVPPIRDVASQIDELEKLVGVIPLSLLAWFEVVGSVCFVGSHPTLASYDAYGAPSGFSPHPHGSDRGIYSDPLWMESIEYILQEQQAFNEMDCRDYGIDGPTSIELSPDVFHKSNVSGGAPYCIHVPNAAIDAILENEEHHLYLVDYLRLSFRWGGFPGFDLYGKTQTNTKPAEIPTDELAHLSKDLWPI